jgi:hypothetical protein
MIRIKNVTNLLVDLLMKELERAGIEAKKVLLIQKSIQNQ